MPQDPPTPTALASIKARLRQIAKRLNYVHKAMTAQQVVDHYTGAQRRVYQRAADSLDEPLSWVDTRIKTFVKREKWDFNTSPKAPRCIQARSPRFNLLLAMDHKPIEHRLYRLRQTRDTTQLPGRHRLFAKGRNWTQRAADCREHWSQFRDPVAVKVDARKFDGTLHKTLLEQTHGFYYSLSKSKRHLRLLRQTIYNTCRTRNGIKYKVDGTRMSGDIDTAMGNALIMVAALQNVIKVPHLLYDDGDDCLIFMERCHLLQFLATFSADMHEYGLNVGVDSIAYQFEHIEFCQHRPANLGGVWRFTPNPIKQMRGAFSSTAEFMQGSDGAYTRACAASLAGTADHQPLTWALATQALAATERFTPRYDRAQLHAFAAGYKPRLTPPQPPTDVDRENFSATWGITPDQQLEYEAMIQFPDVPANRKGNYTWATSDVDYLQQFNVYRPCDPPTRPEFTLPAWP